MKRFITYGTFCQKCDLIQSIDSNYCINVFHYGSVPDDKKNTKKRARKSKQIKNIFLSIFQMILLPFFANKLIEKFNNLESQYNVSEPNFKYIFDVMGAYVGEIKKDFAI